MNQRIVFFAVLMGLAMGLTILELIRKKRLNERYALLWLASASVLIVLSFWRDLLEKLAVLMGVYYAPSALFIIAFFCVLLLMLHFSTVISRLSDQNTVLAQEVAILQERVVALEKQLEKKNG